MPNQVASITRSTIWSGRTDAIRLRFGSLKEIHGENSAEVSEITATANEHKTHMITFAQCYECCDDMITR